MTNNKQSPRLFLPFLVMFFLSLVWTTAAQAQWMPMNPVRQVQQQADLVEAEPLPFDQLLGGGVELDAGQDLFVTDAAPRVAVGDVDQYAHRVLAIADDVRRDPLRDRNHVTVDDEHAIVVAFDEALHHDDTAPRLADGPLVAAPDVFLGAQVEAEAVDVEAVLGRILTSKRRETVGQQARSVASGHDDRQGGSESDVPGC